MEKRNRKGGGGIMTLTKVSSLSVVGTRSYFEKNKRLDMYFVHPEKIEAFAYLNKVAKTNRFSFIELWKLLVIPPNAGRNPTNNSGPVLVIKPAKLSSDFVVDTENAETTSEQEYDRSEKGQLKQEDILLLSAAHAAGYIGRNTSIFVEKDVKAICIGELIRLRPNKEAINPYYLLGYLNTPFAKTLLMYSVRGQTVHLYPSDIRNLPVILPPRKIQDSIGNKLKGAIGKKIEAKKKKKEIDEIFAKYLPMDFEVPIEVAYIYTKNDAHIVNRRLDAHFYHPKYSYVIQLINRSPPPKKELRELISFSKSTCNPEKIGDKKFKYIEIDNINLNLGYIENHSEVIGKNAPCRARKVLKEHNLLIPLTRPYRGAIGVVDAFYNDSIGTTGFSVSYQKSDDCDTYYVCAFLKTKFGIMQIEQRMSNANYPAVIESNLKDILVSVFPESERFKISENMRAIISFSRESQLLHQQAMSDLENLLTLNGGASS
jgi:restriction endonuclease S subunit